MGIEVKQAEYIEREAAIAVIYGQHIGGKEACENARPNTYGADLREIVADIEDIPTADVVAVVRCEEKAEVVARRLMRSGLIREEKPQKWEFLFNALDGTPRYGCPVCKELEWRKTNFCPNCGAKMDLEVQE